PLSSGVRERSTDAGFRTRAANPPVTEQPRAAPSPTAPYDRLGLTGATALVVGSIVGVGIFNLPSSLAAYGPITLVSMGLTTIGALALARLFASLSRRMPADGGPYAYARVAFGNELGFANAWSYWITAWAGNAAIAVGWVLYVEVFINKGLSSILRLRLWAATPSTDRVIAMGDGWSDGTCAGQGGE